MAGEEAMSMTTHRLPRPLTHVESERLRLARVHPLDTAALTFLVETGLRSAGALSITRTEAEGWPVPGRILGRHPRAVTRIVEKGDRERAVLLSRDALLASRILLSSRGQNGRGEYLFPWSDRTLRLRFQQWGDRAGVHLHPHRARHTAISEWVEAGTPIDVVAEMAGHATVDVTRLYYASSERARREAITKRRRWRRRFGGLV